MLFALREEVVVFFRQDVICNTIIIFINNVIRLCGGSGGSEVGPLLESLKESL